MRIPVDFFLEEPLDHDGEPPFYVLSKRVANALIQGLTAKKHKNYSKYTKLISVQKKIIFLHKKR